VTSTPLGEGWNRHTILAALKIKYGSLKAFAATTPFTIGQMSVALGMAYPSVDRAIARGLERPLHELWPDRYNADGTRKASPSSQSRFKASPEARARRQKSAAATNAPEQIGRTKLTAEARRGR